MLLKLEFVITSILEMSSFKQILIVALLVAGPFELAPLKAAQLKKVLVLDFRNLSGKPEMNYLENSLGSSVGDKLKEKYTFKRTDRRDWQPVADENYIFSEDLYTKTAALNLGLLAKQDVIVTGSFTTMAGSPPKVLITVRILDVSKRKEVMSFVEEGPADSRIFDTIDKTAVRIADAMAKVLPTTDEWKRSGLIEPGAAFISDFRLAAKGGGVLAVGGWADVFDNNQPVLGLEFSATLPIISRQVFLSTSFHYNNKDLNPDADTQLNRLNVDTSVASFFFMGAVGYEVNFGINWTARLKGGGGMVMESWQIGNGDESVSIPAVMGGFETLYRMSGRIYIVWSMETVAQLDDVTTYANFVTLGSQYAF